MSLSDTIACCCCSCRETLGHISLSLCCDVGTHFAFALFLKAKRQIVRREAKKSVSLSDNAAPLCPRLLFSPRLRSDIMLIQPSGQNEELVFNENKQNGKYPSQHKANPTQVVAQLNYHSISREKSNIAKQCIIPTPRKQTVEGVSNSKES